MKKTSRLILSCLGVFFLASCTDTSELYPGNAYVGQDFIANRYHEWPASLKGVTNLTSVTLHNEQTGYFNGSGKHDTPRDNRGFDQAKEWHPNWFKNPDGTQLYWVDPVIGSDIINGGVGEYRDQSPLYGTVYSQTKKLTRINSAFSKGYLSKLYNGQVRCNAWSYYSMVLLDKEGYGTFFPSELNTAEYFAFSARGGRNSNDGGVGNVVTFGINVTFYRYKEDGKTLVSNTVVLEDVQLQANYSSEFTSLVGFKFSDAGINPKGIVGMSMSLAALNDPYQDGEGRGSSCDFSDNETYHTGLCLLEVLLPDSTWF